MRCIAFICFLSLCSRGAAFPSEEQVKGSLKAGLTADEVVALLGEPPHGRVIPCDDCTFTYLPPTGSLTAEKEGYAGVVIRFKDGRVRDWRLNISNPSYEEPKAPPEFWFFLKLYGILFALVFVAAVYFRRMPRAAFAVPEIAQAFASREIRTDQLPADFHFINHNLTVRDVIDRLGEPSRVVEVPISTEEGWGYAMASSGAKPALTVYEYDLPYHAAVIVIPEFPFRIENKVRAVYYRKVQSEIAAGIDDV